MDFAIRDGSGHQMDCGYREVTFSSSSAKSNMKMCMLYEAAFPLRQQCCEQKQKFPFVSRDFQTAIPTYILIVQ